MTDTLVGIIALGISFIVGSVILWGVMLHRITKMLKEDDTQ